MREQYRNDIAKHAKGKEKVLVRMCYDAIPNTEGEYINCRNYDYPHSVIYNNQKKTVEIWPFQNYSKSFVFDVSGNRISDSR